jgi:uncharacterized heparinase superfamily protein
MTRHEKFEREPGREPGRELVSVGSDAGPSLFQRLAHVFGLGRRAPLRLLAVPRDPVPGDKQAGTALVNGAFAWGRHHYRLDELLFTDPDLPPEVAQRLHSFAWLRDIGAAVTHERGRRSAQALARAWLEALPAKESGYAWRADLWGRRILFWTAYAPYLLSTRDGDYRTRMLRLLTRGARHIEQSADKLPAGLPRIAAWCGAVAAALVVQGGAARLGHAEGGLSRAVRTGQSDDGGLISRAPHQQLELVELFALLRAAYATTSHGLPDWLQEAQEGAVSALLSVTLGDAGLSSWQGGNADDPHRVVAALEGAGADARPLRQARGWGYQRLQNKDIVLIMDAAPPPDARALSGGCASTLAFELSDGAQRLIVNCGGAGEAQSALPAELQHLLRSTAAHSTLILGNYNSTAIREGTGLGRGVAEVTLERGMRDGFSMVEASHDGYVRRFGLVHQRQLLLSPDGKNLTGQDVLIQQGKKPKAATVPFVLRFHLAPGVEVISTADGRGALLRARGMKPWQFKCRGGSLSTEESLWIDGAASPRATTQLVIAGESPADGMTISWELKRAG